MAYYGVSMSLRRRALTAAILGAIGVVVATVIVLIQFTATYATSNAIRARITPAADAVEALVLAQVSASASLRVVRSPLDRGPSLSALHRTRCRE